MHSVRSSTLARIGLLSLGSMVASSGCAEKAPPPAPVPVATPAAPPPSAPHATSAAVAPVPAPAAQSLKLKWNLGPGQRATYRLKDDQKAENHVKQMIERSEAGTAMVTTLIGGEVDSQGLAHVRYSYDDLRAYDSSHGETRLTHTGPLEPGEEDTQRHAALRSLIGEGAVAIVDGTGKITDIVDAQIGYQHAHQRIKDLDTTGWLQVMYPIFNREAMLLNFNTTLNCLPGGEVKVGDTWKTQGMRSSQAGLIVFDREWKLESVEDKDGTTLARITGKTTVSLPTNDGVLANMYKTVISKGEGTGEVVFDMKLGLVRSARMVTTFEFSNTAQDGQDPFKYPPYAQSLEDVTTLELLATGENAKPADIVAEPDVKAPAKPNN